jgi:hypothetical protein
MIRNLLVIAAASFVLMLGCFAGVAALAGPVILKDGWTIPFDHNDDGPVRPTHIDITGTKASPIVSRQMAWTGEALTVDLPLDVIYVQGPVAKIEISGPKAVVDRLRIEAGRISLIDGDVDGDHVGLNADNLTIDRHGIRVHSKADQMKIVVTAPNVSTFQLNGSGDLEIRDYNQAAMTLAINGSGDVSAAGKATALVLATAGSGDAELDDLQALDAQIAISGSGDADISASNTVKIDISGSGDVGLQAQPANESSTISGSGSVRHNY